MNLALWIVQGCWPPFSRLRAARKWSCRSSNGEAAGAAGLVLEVHRRGEVLGALGLVLPGLLRIGPSLTPLAAAALVAASTARSTSARGRRSTLSRPDSRNPRRPSAVIRSTAIFPCSSLRSI
jgi:hypothetical protein